MTLDQVLVLVGVIVTAAGIGIGVLQSWRKDARERDAAARAAITAAIEAAIDPIRRELDQRDEAARAAITAAINPIRRELDQIHEAISEIRSGV